LDPISCSLVKNPLNSFNLDYIFFCLLQLDPRLALLQRNQNPTWYQTLARLMLSKYGASTRQFQSPEGQVNN
jgi:hypothetical protein